MPPQVFDFAAVIWGPKEGEIHELPPLPGDNEGVPTGINDNGQVVGTSANCAVGSIPIHAVLWEDGKPTNLGSFGGAVLNIAFGINNRGQIVGGSDLPGDTAMHAFFCESAPVAGRGGTGKRKDVILPESVRKLLRQRMAKRWHIPGV